MAHRTASRVAFVLEGRRRRPGQRRCRCRGQGHPAYGRASAWFNSGRTGGSVQPVTDLRSKEVGVELERLDHRDAVEGANIVGADGDHGKAFAEWTELLLDHEMLGHRAERLHVRAH